MKKIGIILSVAIVLLSEIANAGLILRKTALYTSTDKKSTKILELEKDSQVTVSGTVVTVRGFFNDEEWVTVNTDGKNGFVPYEDILLTDGDVDFTASQWKPTWLIKTSPVGDIAKRYNLAVERFVSRNFAVGLKGTTIDNAQQNVFGHDDGYEIGVRGSFYLGTRANREPPQGLSIHFGVYYTKFDRGNDLGDLLNYASSATLIDRDVVDGLMYELLIGEFIRLGGVFGVEVLTGAEMYHVTHYRINTSSGAKTEREKSGWRIGFDQEINLVIAF